MRVKLISSGLNLLDTIYIGARTCYNEGSPINMYEDMSNISNEDKLKLVKSCIKSGHHAVLEHSSFTFALEGVTRVALAQISRHRLCSLCVQSQRYVEFKENLEKLEYMFTHGQVQDLIKILDKYFEGVNEDNVNGFYYALTEYLRNTRKGVKAEDARAILPNATKTNMVITMNLREFIHMCGLRLCSRAQKEFRVIMQSMVNEVVKENEWLKEYLTPKCYLLGYCDEAHGSCGRKPKKKDIIK